MRSLGGSRIARERCARLADRRAPDAPGLDREFDYCRAAPPAALALGRAWDAAGVLAAPASSGPGRYLPNHRVKVQKILGRSSGRALRTTTRLKVSRQPMATIAMRGSRSRGSSAIQLGRLRPGSTITPQISYSVTDPGSVSWTLTVQAPGAFTGGGSSSSPSAAS